MSKSQSRPRLGEKIVTRMLERLGSHELELIRRRMPKLGPAVERELLRRAS